MKHAWFPVTLSFVLTHSSDRFDIYIYKWRNQRGRIDSFTYIYPALLPQHWALYAKVDSTPHLLYINIYIYIYYYYMILYIYIYYIKQNKTNWATIFKTETNTGFQRQRILCAYPLGIITQTRDLLIPLTVQR